MNYETCRRVGVLFSYALRLSSSTRSSPRHLISVLVRVLNDSVPLNHFFEMTTAHAVTLYLELLGLQAYIGLRDDAAFLTRLLFPPMSISFLSRLLDTALRHILSASYRTARYT